MLQGRIHALLLDEVPTTTEGSGQVAGHVGAEFHENESEGKKILSQKFN